MIHLEENKKRSAEILEIIQKGGFDKEVNELSIAIIDLIEENPTIFGVNLDLFTYPASVYKIFIGAEVLRQIEKGTHTLEELVIVKAPNDVDKDARLFPGDSRPIIKAGDTVTTDYLLDLMLTRSDNTASNCLIDLVGRESITENIIYKHGWQGSEVTRKFLNRTKEDKPYRFIETTKACVRHVAEFFYLIETEQLISPFVSQKMKEYMLNWNRGGRKGFSIPEYVSYYRKGGLMETNLYKSLYIKNGLGIVRGLVSLIKTILTKGWAFLRYMNDAGVVKGKHSHYVVVVFTLSKQFNPRRYFHMDKLAKAIYEYMEEVAK